MAEKKAKILFVCVENSCRSQMAEGFARVLGGDKIEAFSAGSKPSGTVDPDAIVVMKEVDIDISQARSKGFADLPVQDYDYAVTMGCEDVCPFFPAREELIWDIPDPKGRDLIVFRTVRDEIKRQVAALIKRITAEKGGDN
ncbi:MAG TPA: arsenate reductase ArsC [Candidatus Sulfotelmatobacter sp.]|nr:arsenate reductase ArsC [Candidatus Sulfotelmatobacter sp.]